MYISDLFNDINETYTAGLKCQNEVRNVPKVAPNCTKGKCSQNVYDLYTLLIFYSQPTQF